MAQGPQATPTLAEAIGFAIGQKLGDLHVAIPCKVQAYDHDKQSADLIPQIRRPLRALSGEVELEALPVLPSVPVLQAFGGGSYLRFQLEPGDNVIAIFTDYTITGWVDQGSQDPKIDTPHTLAGACCFPVTFAQTGDGVAPATVAIGRDGGKSVSVTDSAVALGTPTAADFVALASKVDQNFAAAQSWAQAHTHPHALGPGTTSPPAVPPPSPSATGSTVVKSE